MKYNLLIIALFSSILGWTQYDMEDAKDSTKVKTSKIDWTEQKKKIYVGGDISLSFGNQLYFYIAPMAGYDFYKGLSAGISPMYQVYRQNFTNGSSTSYHSYGASTFLRYRPIPLPFLLLQAETGIINTDDWSTAVGGDRANVPLFMMGAGYAGGIGNSYYQIMLMYDFVDDPNNPLPRLFFNLPLYLRYGMVFYLGQ